MDVLEEQKLSERQRESFAFARTKEQSSFVKYDLFLITILIISIVAFIVQAYFVSKIWHVGYLDLQHFSNAAENLLKGNGFALDYINQYFVKIDSIPHPEEWGFTGASILIAPFIALFGKTAFTVKLPNMLIYTILFPLLTYFIGKEFFDKKIAFLAGVSMLFYPQTFHLSFGGERDPVFAFFLLLGFYFFYKGFKEKNYFYLMGLAIGFSFLIRQLTLIIFPLLILIYYLIEKKFSKQFLLGLALAGIVASPWLIRNYFIFGDPLFTVNKYIVWIEKYIEHYEQGAFAIYWGGTVKQLPSQFWVLQTAAGRYFYFAKSFNSLTAELLSFFFLNILAFGNLVLTTSKKLSKRVKIWIVLLIALAFILDGPLLPAFIEKPLLYIGFNAGSAILILVRAFPYIGMLLTSVFIFARETKERTIFVLLWATFSLFFAFYWTPETRFFLPIIPFLLLFSWKTVILILEKIPEAELKQYMDKILAAILIFVILTSLPMTFGKFYDKNQGFPYRDDESAKLTFLISLKIENITQKNDVIMACGSGTYNFYTGRKFVEMPSDNLQNTFGIVKIYNVSYITFMGCQTRFVNEEFLKIITDSYPPPSGYEFNLYEIRPKEVGEKVEIEVIAH